MAFNVIFYTINKQHNSTGLPAGTGSSYSCVAKEPLSIMSPTIVLRMDGGAAGNPVAWNYAYISDFGRYYWISDWTNVGPNWEASMQVDVLATYRTDIRSYQAYVLRASQDYNPEIPDRIYPATCEKTCDVVEMVSPWEGIPEPIVDNTAKGFYSVGVASAGAVSYYAMLGPTLEYLLSYLMSDAYAAAALSVLQISMYPEAKIALSPLQYITSIKYIPFVGPYTAGTTVSSIKVGPVDVSITCRTFATESARAILTVSRSMATHRHPESATRGNWLNQAPWTTYELFYPPFGLIPLDSTIMAKASTLYLFIVVDCRTGTAILNGYAELPSGNTTEQVQIIQAAGNVAIDIPISGMLTRQPGGMTVALQTLTGVAGAVAGIASGNYVGAAASALNAANAVVGDAVAAAIPHMSVVGSQGSSAALTGTPCLNIVYTGLSDELNREYGRPLCEAAVLSTLSPGFVMCGNADLAISGTIAEQNQVNSYLNGGVHLA